jgi:hypothetical protein
MNAVLKMDTTAETEAEFIERRRKANEQAAIEAGDDPLIKALFGPHEPVVISERERRLFCFQPGWMFKKQA